MYVTAITIIIICFNSLLSSAQKGYKKVCKWVKCDIFQKKYLIVPINEDFHWYLAIIYEPENFMNLNCNE
jgi:Ulp1 family protease